jgi:hypothetical protein
VSPVRIKQLLDTKPFEPFTVVTGDGTAVDVLSREFAWLKPGNRTLVVAVPLKRRPSEESDFEDHNIDVFLITKVISPARRNGNGRSKKP